MVVISKGITQKKKGTNLKKKFWPFMPSQSVGFDKNKNAFLVTKKLNYKMPLNRQKNTFSVNVKRIESPSAEIKSLQSKNWDVGLTASERKRLDFLEGWNR
jgi:hypothetical protein